MHDHGFVWQLGLPLALEHLACCIIVLVLLLLQVFEVGGEVLQPQLAHNLCRLVAEQDSELHSTAVKMFLDILDHGTTAATASGGGAAAAGSAGGAAAVGGKSAVLPEILLCCICWVLGEYGSLAGQLPPPWKATTGQVGELRYCCCCCGDRLVHGSQ